MLTPFEPAVATDRPAEWLRLAELDVKYEGYINRQEAQVERFERMETLTIPEGFDYDALAGISTEEPKQKLKKIQPRSAGRGRPYQRRAVQRRGRPAHGCIAAAVTLGFLSFTW